jgi:hypothetical protein
VPLTASSVACSWIEAVSASSVKNDVPAISIRLLPPGIDFGPGDRIDRRLRCDGRAILDGR